MSDSNRNTISASSFALLHPDFPAGCWLEQSDENPLRYAVWCDGEIIGASDNEDEAIAEARATVRGWAERDVSESLAAGESR